MLQPMYKFKEFVTNDNYPNIDSIIVMNDAVNRHDRDAVIAAFALQDVNFNEKDIVIGLQMSKVAASTVKPFRLDWSPAYDAMTVGQYQVSTIISSVSNKLEPLLLCDALVTSMQPQSSRCLLEQQTFSHLTRLLIYGLVENHSMLQ